MVEMPASPLKPAHEMTEDELREWKQRLFTEGVSPVPIRQEASTSVSSYAWDPDLDATVEYANGNRYIVGVRDGKLTRLASGESVTGSEDAGSRPALATKIPAPQTAHPNLPAVRKRKLA
jgi:hypothetical protein